MTWVKQDWRENRGRPQIQICLLLFRFAQLLRRSDRRFVRILGLPAAAVYRLFALSMVGFDIPVSTTVGRGLTIHHGIGLVVNNRTTIGVDVVLRQNTTLGSRDSSGEAPTIGDRVDVGANAIVLGRVTIGPNAKIGAGALVLHDVPAGGRAVSRPATIKGSGLSDS